MHQKKINSEKMKESLERLFSIYKDISFNADEIMKKRCPYKNAKSRCTALFKCQNQKFVKIYQFVQGATSWIIDLHGNRK